MYLLLCEHTVNMHTHQINAMQLQQAGVVNSQAERSHCIPATNGIIIITACVCVYARSLPQPQQVEMHHAADRTSYSRRHCLPTSCVWQVKSCQAVETFRI